MVNETALKEAFSKIRDEFSSIKNQIQDLNEKLESAINNSDYSEEYRELAEKEILIQEPKKEKTIEESISKGSENTEKKNKTDEIIDADSYY
ncbi:hypothetical protein CL617_05580 [archaeon]|nr:hypothetical protein [archaeon]|tara:strand:- start:4605 stop:4880 length:276 start_codon:yes stop_codon:yes gene_type:complete